MSIVKDVEKVTVTLERNLEMTFNAQFIKVEVQVELEEFVSDADSVTEIGIYL